MATYLLTVQPEDFHAGMFSPELRVSRFRTEPVLKSIAPGRRMQLLRPDGTTVSAQLREVLVEGLQKISYNRAARNRGLRRGLVSLQVRSYRCLLRFFGQLQEYFLQAPVDGSLFAERVERAATDQAALADDADAVRQFLSDVERMR